MVNLSGYIGNATGPLISKAVENQLDGYDNSILKDDIFKMILTVFSSRR